MKPLFIPLKTKYFNQFKDGTKTKELRRYGKRWNENTCSIGREVILSKGYGKHERLKKEIHDFYVIHGSNLNYNYKKDVLDVYGTLDIRIAIIKLKEKINE